ncbi:MAG: M28 family peptidase, partial [Candidatus Zipacnadales bacterium]
VMDIIRVLTEDLGPRQSCSEGERATAVWLADKLREAGYDVEVDEFPACATFMAIYAPLTIVGTLGLPCAWWWPGIGGGLGLIAAALLVLENYPIPLFSRLVKLNRSHNVVAKRRPISEPTQDIVVLAHIDSAVLSNIRDLRLVRILFVGMVLSCAIVGAIGLALQMGMPRWVWLLGTPFMLHLLLCSVIMIHQALCSPVVAGAGDNASGVAAMLQAARELPPLHRSTIWFVGDGGEEAGLLGALRLLQTHSFQRDRTWFINVDMVSAGELQVSVEEGMLFRYRCNPYLWRIATEVGKAEDWRVSAAVMRNMLTDACVPLSRGYRGTTISSTKGYWHQCQDTIEKIEPPVIVQAATLIGHMITRLDRGTADGSV